MSLADPRPGTETDWMTTNPASETAAPQAASTPKSSNKTLWLLAPGVLWMVLFLLVPILMMVYVSFWTQTTFKIEPILTTKSWVTFFSSDTYLDALWTTIRIWLTVLAATIVVGSEKESVSGQTGVGLA